MVRPALALLGILAVLTLGERAHANEKSSADSLFNEGAALLKAGKVPQACEKLAESQRVEPAIGTLGLLAYCHEQSGKLATALREYEEVAQLAHLASQAEREKVARERVAQLSQRVSRLAVVLTEPRDDFEVRLDERQLTASELSTALPIDAGEITLRVTGRDVEPWSQSVTVEPDGSTLRVVVPRLVSTRREPPVVVAPAAPAPAPSHDLRRPAMWASLGVGAAGVALGSVFGLSALSARSDAEPHCVGNVCDQDGVDARERALDRARVSTIAFAAGAAFAATGVVLWITDNSGQHPRRASLRALPGGGQVSWEGRF